MPHSNPPHRAFCRSTYMLCLVIGFLFLSLSPTKAELLYNRPIKTDTWKGAEIEYLGGTVIVQINSDADSAAVESLFAAHGCYAIHYSGWNGWALVGCDTSASVFQKIDSLKAAPLISWAEPNGIAHLTSAPNDPLFQDSTQWALWNTGKAGWSEDADIDALEAWEIERGDMLLIIAVLDTGFPYNTCNGNDYQSGDYCQEDLTDENRFILGYDCSDSVAGCISVDDGGFLADEGAAHGYHGSMVTGIISAMTNNSTGMAGIVWDCKTYVMKLYPSSPNYISAAAYNVSLAMNLAVDYGAKIINFSSGWYYYYCEMVEQVIERADSAKCILITTTGNEGSPLMLFPAAFATYANRDWNCCNPDPDSCPDYPDNCGHRNVIAVGAIERWDNHASFSNCGTDDYRVTVLAPTQVISTHPTKPGLDTCFRADCTGNWAVGIAGTSASAPHVAGVAALVQSYALSKDNDLITPDSVRTLIEWTADDVETEGWDNCCGFGRVNALRALMAMDGYYPNATGYLRANTTWGDTLGDTLYVLGDIVIPEACTLTIDSGAVIKFLTNDREDFGVDSTKCEIIVQGKLVVNGAQNDSVWFISDSAVPSDSDWYGITLDSTGTIELNYCNIENALAPIPWDSVGKYDLSHVKIKHCRDGITVGSSMYFELSHCAFEENTNGITVSTGGSLRFDSCAVIKYDGNGINVQIGGSAKLTGCLFELNHTGLYFNNAASDSVVGCTFKNDFMYGINAQNNDNLLVDGCIFVDSTGSDSGYYGILCRSDLSIENSFFQGYKYGIKVMGKKGTTVSPLIEDCGFYNIGEVGVWSTSGTEPTIKKCCFKGSYDKACIQIDGEDPYVSQCYMASENGEILIGMLFTNGATGTIRKTTIWNYDSCAVQIDGVFSNPDFGNSDSIGCNWFEEPGAGGYYFISSSLNTIQAKSNYWDVDDGDTSGIREKIVGYVDIHPISGKCDHCYPYYSEQCSDLSPSDPTFEPCKIVAAGEDQKEREEEKQKGSAPREFALSQNYPNPFNPQTVIRYDLPEPVHVELAVYNALGQKVRTLVDEKQEEGYKTIIWHGKTDQGEEVASGIYFFKLRTGDFEQTKKMILLR